MAYEGFTTGSTLLNLAITNQRNVGYVPSKIYHFYGEPSTGKSYLATEGILYAYNYAKKHNLTPHIFYIDMEGGFLDSFVQKLSPELVELIDEGEQVQVLSFDTFEEVFGLFEDELRKLTENDFMYFVVDSIDALVTKDDLKMKLTDGSYGTGLAKKISQTLRRFLPTIKHKNVVLILISQIRDNIVPGYGATRKTFAGGYMLKHGPHVSIYLQKISVEKKRTKAGEVPIGLNVKFEVKKNRLAEPFRTGEFTILFDAGIDDVGSCLKFLASAGKVEQKGSAYSYKDLRGRGISSLANKVIEAGLVEDLRKEVEECWLELLEESKTGRLPSSKLWLE